MVVRYLVVSKGPAGFQGEIQITNNTAQPIWNWQIVVTLYDDAVTSFTNADGFFSNGILVRARPARLRPRPPTAACWMSSSPPPDSRRTPGLRLRRDPCG